MQMRNEMLARKGRRVSLMTDEERDSHPLAAPRLMHLRSLPIVVDGRSLARSLAQRG